MKSPLSTYLHDHLAGAEFALETLKALREEHADDATGTLAGELHVEIEQDRSVLEQLAKLVNGSASSGKDAVAWLAEKASRLKLRTFGEGSLGTFEKLETIALGILGKESLWNALAIASVSNESLQGVDYSAMAARAKAQYNRIEAARLSWVPRVFNPAAGTTSAR